MGLFFKKSSAKVNGEDRELIERNGNAVSALIVLAGDDTALVEELTALREKLKYLMPSEDKCVREKDKKISDVLGDLRIALSKRDGKSIGRVKEYIAEILLLAADRNV